jgi:pimeloyl-ACP methyl ester carboxylesterase
MKATIILVHGAFTESASWDDVIDPLGAAGHPVIAAANPLRGLAADAAAISDVVRAVNGPIVLVGHAYGGAVTTNVAANSGDIRAVVYVSAFVPDHGESCIDLSQKFPGSSLGDAVRSTSRRDGSTDLVIAQDRFHEQFCADVPARKAAQMAVTQRPVALEAIQELSGNRPLWGELPSWFIYGDEDRNIPVALQRFMAERAGARQAVEIEGGSHALSVSQPKRVAELVLKAAAAAQSTTDRREMSSPMALDPLGPIAN